MYGLTPFPEINHQRQPRESDETMRSRRSVFTLTWGLTLAGLTALACKSNDDARTSATPKPFVLDAGPAIIEQSDTTTVVEPRMAVRVDRFHNLIVEAA